MGGPRDGCIPAVLLELLYVGALAPTYSYDLQNQID